MVVNKIKKTLRNSNSSRVRKVLLLIFLFLLFCPVVNAQNNTLYMDSNVADIILTHFQNNEYNCFSSQTINTSFQQKISSILSNFDRQTFADKFNTVFQEISGDIDSDITFQDVAVSFAYSYDYNINTFTIDVYVPKTKQSVARLVNNGYFQIDDGFYQYKLSNIPDTSQFRSAHYYIYLNRETDNITSYYCSAGNISSSFRSPDYQIISENNTIYLPFLMTFSDNFKISYRDTIYNANKYLQNIINFEEDNTESAIGYSITENSGNDRVNIYPNLSYLLNTDIFIGNDLTYTYDIYYYSGDEKISIKNQLNENSFTNSGDYGKWYSWQIPANVRKTLKNNTNYYLDMTLYNGNNSLEFLNEFLMFTTFYEMNTNSGDTGNTGTIVNSSGDESGKVDLTGIETGIDNINNNITNSTQTIVSTISGETEKIVNSLDNISSPYSGDIDNDLPSSGEILQKTGYHERVNPYQGFWLSFISGLNENLLNDENVSLEFPDMTGSIHTINSSDFLIPDNPLKVYTNVAMTSFLVFQMLKFIREIINGLNQGKINVLHDVDADVYFF